MAHTATEDAAELRKQEQAAKLWLDKWVNDKLLEEADKTSGTSTELFWARSGQYGTENLVLMVDSADALVWQDPKSFSHLNKLVIARTEGELLKKTTQARRDRTKGLSFCVFSRAFVASWDIKTLERSIITFK